MTKIKEIFKKTWVKKIAIVLVILASVWWAGKGIFKYSVFSTHDLDHHVARSFDAVETFSEGHFPLRWAGSLNYNCGVPIYNFFYPLIYYLVIFIHSINPDVIMALKIIDFASLLFGTLFFYLWMKTETKKYLPAIGGALLYLYAPYRFSLIFVRGSPEFLAYAILPAVLWLYALFFDSTRKKEILFAFLASFAGAMLAISHNFTVMFLFPIILIYLFVKSILLKIDLKKILLLAFSFAGSFGLSGFFIGPALLEKKFTRIGENFLFWKEHFPTLGQLIKSPWGYFYSSLGTHNDGMSFMLGYAHWLILGIAVLFILYRAVFRKKIDIWIILTFLASIFTIYLILPWSIPLWEKLPLLQEIQFSWRLLGVAVFTISALFSYILDKIDSKIVLIPIFAGVVFLGFYGNRNHLLPQPISVQDVYKYDDFEKLHFHRYSTTTLGDDVIAKGAENACWFDTPLVAAEKEKINYNAERGNTYGFVKFEIPTKLKEKILTVGLGYFPGAYEFQLNGKKVVYNNCGGKACLDANNLQPGVNYLSWKIIQTPIESAFNKISLAFIVFWLILLLTAGKLKRHYFLILVFVGFVFLRTYNLPGRIGFGWDQERDAAAAGQILAGNPTLIGPRVQGPAGFFLPPYFFYLLAPFYKAFNFDPNATAGFIAVLAGAFSVLSYLLISKIFDRKIALLFLILWSVNPMAVSIDTISWNPVLIPMLSLILIYAVYRAFRDQNPGNLLFAAVVFGFGASFHLQFLLFFPIFIPLIFDVIKSGKFKILANLPVGAVIPFIPLILFDFRHNFLNLKQMTAFSENSGGGINRTLIVWERASSFMAGANQSTVLGLGVFLAVSVGLLYFSKRLENKVQGKLMFGLFLTWILSLPIFYLFVGNPSEYYFNYLLPIFVILLAVSINRLKQIGVLITLAISVFWLIRSLPLLRNTSLNLREKNEAVIFLSKAVKDSGPFNISFDVPFNEDAGFRYLLDRRGVKYSGNPKDPLIEFVIPAAKRKEVVVLESIGISFPKDFVKVDPLR